jgi:DNA-directed RNA polymerase subunit RPC12/RpoP
LPVFAAASDAPCSGGATIAKRSRTARREQKRALEKAAALREKLFGLSPGGTAERPLDVVSPATIEPHVGSVECPRCGGRLMLDEHAAVTVSGSRLREARLRCTGCGSRRSLWFRIVPGAS